MFRKLKCLKSRVGRKYSRAVSEIRGVHAFPFSTSKFFPEKKEGCENKTSLKLSPCPQTHYKRAVTHSGEDFSFPHRSRLLCGVESNLKMIPSSWQPATSYETARPINHLASVKRGRAADFTN